MLIEEVLNGSGSTIHEKSPLRAPQLNSCKYSTCISKKVVPVHVNKVVVQYRVLQRCMLLVLQQEFRIKAIKKAEKKYGQQKATRANARESQEEPSN